MPKPSDKQMFLLENGISTTALSVLSAERLNKASGLSQSQEEAETRGRGKGGAKRASLKRGGIPLYCKPGKGGRRPSAGVIISPAQGEIQCRTVWKQSRDKAFGREKSRLRGEIIVRD